MLKLLDTYRKKTPEIVFEWHDSETEARGWVVINSLRNGAAGGGTRMRKGLTREEVVSLAKVMEIKFSVAGPPIGGAKSGIDFDPNDPRRMEVLRRWYQAVLPLLKFYYGTGGDLNVDELKDVIPLTEALGLWHPQEGIVHGHLQPIEGEQIKILGQLRHGCAKVVEDPLFVPRAQRKYAVADLITGYGVAESVRHYYDLFRDSPLEGKTAIVQGWGNVASAAGYYLACQGVRIRGIIDRVGGVWKDEGFSQEEITQLFLDKTGNRLQSEALIPFEEMNRIIWERGAQIFIPGAASKIVTPQQVESLIAAGLELIACGANVPFTDDEVFFGPTAMKVDREVGIIPDFIANCGMARVFAYLMQPDVPITDKAIFGDVSHTIRKALAEVHRHQPSPVGIAARALEIALRKLMPESRQVAI